MYIKDNVWSEEEWNVWSDGDPQVCIKDTGWNVWSDGNPQVYIKDIGWNVCNDGNPQDLVYIQRYRMECLE